MNEPAKPIDRGAPTQGSHQKWGAWDRPAPEFGRWQDVERIFGIKRGTLYNLKNAGKIRSVSLRKPGQKFAVRLFHLPSIHDYLHRQMQQQETAGEDTNFEPSTDAGFDD